MDRLAPAPSRASTSFVFGFGLIAIPLAVYGGQVETGVTRSQFYLDTDVSVKRPAVRADTGEVIDFADVQLRAKADNGVWVELTNDEVAEVTMPRRTAEIVARVPRKDIGNYVITGVSQVRPKREKGKLDPSMAKAWSLFCAALKDTKTVVLIKAALYGKPQHYLLTHDGDLLSIATADAIREPVEVVETPLSAAERALAKRLLETIPVETPVLTDTTAQAVQAFVNSKAEGKTPPTSTHTPAGTPEDLMAAITASLEAIENERKAS